MKSKIEKMRLMKWEMGAQKTKKKSYLIPN